VQASERAGEVLLGAHDVATVRLEQLSQLFALAPKPSEQILEGLDLERASSAGGSGRGG
jgi:hypothetical protein